MEPSTQASNTQGYDDPVIAQQAKNLTKAIFQHESGMDFNAVGDAGTSKGAGQWQPDTWKAEAKDVLGDENAPMTPENQSIVAQGTIRKLIKQGKNAAQIAAIWNSGSDKNWENKVGKTVINGQTISYNVPKYVKDVTDLYQQYKGQTIQGVNQSAQPNTQGYITQPSLPSGTGQPLPPPSFAQEASGDISSAIGGAGNALSQTISGKINPLSGAIQGLGALAGGASSLINTAATHLPVVGGVVQGAENLLGQGVGALAQTQAGQYVTKEAQDFAQAHPELAGDIGGIANIAGLASTFYGGGAALSAAKEGLASAAAKGVLGTLPKTLSESLADKEALQLVMPKATQATLKAGIQSGRGTVGGVSKTVGLVPDKATTAAADAIKPLVQAGKVGAKKTAVENANAILDEIGVEAKSLRSQLESQEVKPILLPEDLQNLKTIIEGQLQESPLMVGNAELTGQRIFKKFTSYLPTGRDITAEDILSARQKLDKWAQTQRAKIFDAANENAQTTALRIIRRSANNLVAKKAPSIGVKASLARQNALYDALENIAAKGTKEVGTGRVGRFATRHPYLSGAVRGLVRGGLLGAGAKSAADFLP